MFVSRLEETWLAASSVWDVFTHSATFQSKPTQGRRKTGFICLFSKKNCQYEVVSFDTNIIQPRR